MLLGIVRNGQEEYQVLKKSDTQIQFILRIYAVRRLEPLHLPVVDVPFQHRQHNSYFIVADFF